ncbi:multidrug transporter [Sphingomonas oleivorans]|uniref:Multidrug transporter n=1 Tax=Sphingomonas oleivorans TaxID=1735121 RepID=A0A2T5FY47_9SPHN|nr:efflux transporter outer membrane subunit [Sphingomonas oleivorans]PTQ11453.1 multidrug transporter [Sphingomonas oleivorans]
MSKFRGAIPLVALTLSACASVPDLGRAPAPRGPEALASAASLPAGMAAWPGDGWWRGYGDPQLTALIEEGLKGAPDIAIAEARLRQAEGLAQQAGAALGPQVEARGSAAMAKQSYNNGIPAEFVPKGWKSTGNAALSFGLDLDFWGRNRAALRAATSERDAARIETAAARLALATGIASAYADLAQLHADRDVAELALRVRSDSLRLVTNRVEIGLDTQGQLKQAAAAVPAARADLAAIDESIALTRNRIAALTGAGPDRGLVIGRPAIATLHAAGLPASIGLDLVGRRPDIAAARTRATAAAERIKVARADFYPNINLTGLIGLQSLGLSNLTDSGSTYGNVGPAISLPIFQSGRLSGSYRAARGEYDEAVATYDRTLIQAVRDVADVTTSQRALDARLREASQSLADSEAAYSIAKLRYEGGLSTYLDVLSAEQALIGARRTVADLRARAFTLDVALIRALGGGFTSSQTQG